MGVFLRWRVAGFAELVQGRGNFLRSCRVAFNADMSCIVIVNIADDRWQRAAVGDAFHGAERFRGFRFKSTLVL
jgi:hypothetical protein